MREAVCKHQADRITEGRRPRLDRSERGLRPIESSDSLPHFTAASQESVDGAAFYRCLTLAHDPFQFLIRFLERTSATPLPFVICPSSTSRMVRYNSSTAASFVSRTAPPALRMARRASPPARGGRWRRR